MKKVDTIFTFLGLAGVAGTALLAAMSLVILLLKEPSDPNAATQTAAKETSVIESQNLSSQYPVEDGKDEDAVAPALNSEAVDQPAEKADQSLVSAVAAEPVAEGSADLEAGAKVFRKCKACHTITKGDKHKVGPNLWSIVNANVAASEGFSYSKSMTAIADQVWSVELLDRYLADPKGTVKGTKMVFAGIKKPVDRRNLIAFLAMQSDAPVEIAGLVPVAAEPVAEAASEPDNPSTTAASIPGDTPARSPEELRKINAAVAALREEVAILDYERARYHRLHFEPAIAQAADEECLVCHAEILDHKPLERSPAGIEAADTLAWYQTLDTYVGGQESFHYRHLESPLAKKVMNLTCNFCHQGNDPREEAPDMQPGRPIFAGGATPNFTLRKLVNPSKTCLLCHGAMPDPDGIMGIGGPWHEVRGDFEDEETPNGCQTCHAELFRTVRHQVTYLKAASIEDAAEQSSDVCFGCHGGRAWYRIAYPYPRHPWPDMDPEIPEWAVDRPMESDRRYQLKADAAGQQEAQQ